MLGTCFVFVTVSLGIWVLLLAMVWGFVAKVGWVLFAYLCFIVIALVL